MSQNHLYLLSESKSADSSNSAVGRNKLNYNKYLQIGIDISKRQLLRLTVSDTNQIYRTDKFS